MTVWFTADLHLGHANIIGYSCRPFHDVDAMNEALVARWNECVAPQDTVWVLGDVALGHIEDSLAHVGRLAGRKRLLAATTTAAGQATRGRMLNVGVDAWDYRPVDAVTLAEIVSSGPNGRPTSTDPLL